MLGCLAAHVYRGDFDRRVHTWLIARRSQRHREERPEAFASDDHLGVSNHKEGKARLRGRGHKEVKAIYGNTLQMVILRIPAISLEACVAHCISGQARRSPRAIHDGA